MNIHSDKSVCISNYIIDESTGKNSTISQIFTSQMLKILCNFIHFREGKGSLPSNGNIRSIINDSRYWHCNIYRNQYREWKCGIDALLLGHFLNSVSKSDLSMTLIFTIFGNFLHYTNKWTNLASHTRLSKI